MEPHFSSRVRLNTMAWRASPQPSVLIRSRLRPAVAVLCRHRWLHECVENALEEMYKMTRWFFSSLNCDASHRLPEISTESGACHHIWKHKYVWLTGLEGRK